MKPRTAAPSRYTPLRTNGNRAKTLAVLAVLALNCARADNPGQIHYPDLQPRPASDIRVQINRSTGTRLLRFSSIMANLGKGPLEIFAQNNAVTGITDAYQRLYTHDASGDWLEAGAHHVGSFAFHPDHDHWHFENFALYQLRDVASDGSIGGTVLATSGKISFCITDSAFVTSNLEHASPQTYVTCDATMPQGISVGWGDLYSWYLPGQDLDITNLPNADYWIVIFADPEGRLQESATNNNSSAVKIRLASKGNKVRVTVVQ